MSDGMKTDAEKLRALAEWFDGQAQFDVRLEPPENVQEDLRQIADKLDVAVVIKDASAEGSVFSIRGRKTKIRTATVENVVMVEVERTSLDGHRVEISCEIDPASAARLGGEIMLRAVEAKKAEVPNDGA